VFLNGLVTLSLELLKLLLQRTSIQPRERSSKIIISKLNNACVSSREES
jgi:hypothetical protein